MPNGIYNGHGALVEADDIGAHAGHTHVHHLQHLDALLEHRAASVHIIRTRLEIFYYHQIQYHEEANGSTWTHPVIYIVDGPEIIWPVGTVSVTERVSMLPTVSCPNPFTTCSPLQLKTSLDKFAPT